MSLLDRLKAGLAAMLQPVAAPGPDASPAAARGGTADAGPQTRIDTAGGAHVGTSVATRGGHFIGRDFVQYIFQIKGFGEDPEEIQSVIASYLHALAADLAGLKLGEIDPSPDRAKQSPLQLADIYVPLDTTLQVGEDETLAQWLLRRDDPREAAARQHGQATRPVSALEALAAHRRLTVLGKPGSGKSTFGASVLLALAQAWQGRDAAELKQQLGEHWTHGPLLPIRVVLRRFAEQLPAGNAPAHAGDLWDFIARDLDAAAWGLSADALKYVRRLARTRGVLVLFDGLDECGDAVRRDRVHAAIREFIAGAESTACRFVLTARPYAWPSGADPERGVHALAELDDEKIERFVRAWYAALVERGWGSPGDAARQIDDLLRARHRPDLRPLAANPLLLTLMAVLHANRGRLPDDRADLYHESVELLLLRWNQKIGADRALLDALGVPGLKLSDLRRALEKLAFEIHERSVGREGAADIGEGRLMRAFCPLLKDSYDKARAVIDYIETRAALLLGQGEQGGERQFAFAHRTFQEFLAACHLAAKTDFPAECVRLARAAAAHWSVALPLAARIAQGDRGASAADELVGRLSVDEFRRRRRPVLLRSDWECAVLAGMQLQEIGPGAIAMGEGTQAIAERVAGWLAALLPVHPDDGGLPAAQRAQAGDVLSRLGDPRFDPERFHLPADESLGFVRIAADAGFRIGTRSADRQRVSRIVGGDMGDREINDAPTPTPEFHIARYPVTVAQFRAFVEATGFGLGDADALRDPDGRPVRYVSWHEAAAYCAWLNDTLAASPLFADHAAARLVRRQGWQVAMPSELEWEKAARGGLADAVFSWGDTPDAQRANYADSGVNDTSAVGCFPANDYGLHDMLGNAWEWTRSAYGSYPPALNDAQRDVERVVRGGAWSDPRDDARCACRYWLEPDYRYGGLGFRVVLRSVPVS